MLTFQALKDFAAAYPAQSLATSLACAQIHLSNKQVDKAVEVLEGLGDASYKAGVLGALIALCRSLNDDERAAQVRIMKISHIHYYCYHYHDLFLSQNE